MHDVQAGVVLFLEPASVRFAPIVLKNSTVEAEGDH
jgi:hypothetical protein